MGRSKPRTSGGKNRAGVDIGDTAIVPPTRERNQHAAHGIEVAEPERAARGGARAFVDAEGRPSRPWRVVDSLQVLERMGTINADQRATGERFRALFEISGRAGVSASKVEPRSAGGDPMSAVERRVEAGRGLARAAQILGGPGPLHSVVVDVCGLGMPPRVRDDLLRMRHGGSSRMLADALAILSREWWSGKA